LGRFYFAIYGKTKQKDKRKKNCTHCFNSAWPTRENLCLQMEQERMKEQVQYTTSTYTIIIYGYYQSFSSTSFLLQLSHGSKLTSLWKYYCLLSTAISNSSLCTEQLFTWQIKKKAI
jgi:hypothetical protein